LFTEERERECMVNQGPWWCQGSQKREKRRKEREGEREKTT